MNDVATNAEDVSEELADGYARAQALFVLLAAACVYILLASFDLGSSEANEKRRAAERQVSDLASQLELAAGDCHDRYAELRTAWTSANRQTTPLGGEGRCSEACKSSVSRLELDEDTSCGEDPSGLRDVSEQAAADLATGRGIFDKCQAVDAALDQQKQALQRWNSDERPSEQERLKAQYRSARKRVEQQRAELQAAATLATLNVPANGESCASYEDYVKSLQAVSMAANAVLLSVEPVKRLLGERAAKRSALKALVVEIETRKAERLKLPVLDIELERATFHVAAPLLMAALFGFFGSYIIHLKKRLEELQRAHGDGPWFRGDPSAFPWPLLLGSERGWLRSLLAAAAFTLVPAALCALQLQTTHHECRAEEGVLAESVGVCGLLAVQWIVVAFTVALAVSLWLHCTRLPLRLLHKAGTGNER